MVSEDSKGIRLDKFFSQNLVFFSRNQLNLLIREGKVLVNGKAKKPSYRLKVNEAIRIELPEKKDTPLEPFEFSIPISYEDEDILVVDKPAGIVVHPYGKGFSKTLVNSLIFMRKELSTVNPHRPGVVHRLDKDTSGVMVLAKNNRSHLNLVEQFRERKIKKEYFAICWGRFKQERLLLDLPLQRDSRQRLKMKVGFLKAKQALTEFLVLEVLKDATFILAKPLSGRMHQIRVHLRFLEHPIVGDKKYGYKDGYGQLFLHSGYLGLYHPTKDIFLEFRSPLPAYFQDFINLHREKKNV